MSEVGTADDESDDGASAPMEAEADRHELDAGVVVPALPAGKVRPERVEKDLSKWYGLDDAAREPMLKSIVNGRKELCNEALVHVCRQAHAKGGRRMLSLSFEALSKSATPLLLSQAWGLAKDEGQEQVQEILLGLFILIREGKADFAETNFAAFAKRQAISLYRSRKTKFENANQREAPSQPGEQSSDEPSDPLDELPARVPSAEAKALLSRALDRLSAKQRVVFIQYHQYDMTQIEIAEHHGVTVKTVYNWLKAANAIVGISGEDK